MDDQNSTLSDDDILSVGDEETVPAGDDADGDDADTDADDADADDTDADDA